MIGRVVALVVALSHVLQHEIENRTNLDRKENYSLRTFPPFVTAQLYYRQAIMAFKCISGHAPKYLSSQFITREQVTKRTTRSGQKLDIPLFKTASGQRTFYYRTIGLWNNLDPLLKSSCSVQVFKRILKNKLLDNFVNTP